MSEGMHVSGGMATEPSVPLDPVNTMFINLRTRLAARAAECRAASHEDTAAAIETLSASLAVLPIAVFGAIYRLAGAEEAVTLAAVNALLDAAGRASSDV